MTTRVCGKAISSPLKLGKYYVLESKAPAGYLLNPNKIPFELKYTGQAVEITSTAIAQEEQEQKGNATIIKEDSKTGAKPQGGAKLDGAVYELHRKSNAEVELINPVADTIATATFQGADVDWYIKADDIILKKPARNQQNPPKSNHEKNSIK